jgi:acyl carrier protein
MSPTEHQIREVVASIAGISPDASAEADLYLDLGVASVHGLQLLTQLEKQFDLQVPDDDFVEATSIAKLTALVDSLVAEKGRGTTVA